jgi:L-threonylcarbamoyladenylate synthase
MSHSIAAPTPAAIARAAQRLREGSLVAFPTETVYGLGADAANPEAVRRIFAAKGRPADHPVIVHLGDAAQLAQWARTVPDEAMKLAKAFWPGPLTLILPRASHVAGHPDRRSGQHRGPRALASRRTRAPGRVRRRHRGAVGQSVRAAFPRRPRSTSPTISAMPPAMILDGGACRIGIESTIVAFTGDRPVLLRPGGIGVLALTRALGRTLAEP